MKQPRCAWVSEEKIYQKYHDEEWGSLSQFDNDQYLFEMLILEGAQAGLSWITILKRRENYRKAFDNFDPAIVSQYDAAKIAALLQNKGIIRNKYKVNAAVQNARSFINIQQEYGSFSTFLKQFFKVLPMKNNWKKHEDVPAQTEESRALSKTLNKKGFSFVGPVICYAFMQATGIVNDHTQDCYLYDKNKGDT